MQRNTPQRKAIRAVFEEADRPLAPEEVLERGQKAVPGLGIATVYRQVKRLAEEGWLSIVELPGGPLRYEVASLPHHHHFMCSVCGRAFDIDGCPPAVDFESMVPGGFVVESHEIFLSGRCARCS